MKLPVVAATWLLAALLPAGAAHAIDGCQSVRGRMALYNGAPTVRIWVIGTKRILGVSDSREGARKLPDEIQRLWEQGSDDPWAYNVVGEFRVCALTKERAGWMQMVRVESGRNLRLTQAR